MYNIFFVTYVYIGLSHPLELPLNMHMLRPCLLASWSCCYVMLASWSWCYVVDGVGWGGGVGWGVGWVGAMLTSVSTCFMKLMLRHNCFMKLMLRLACFVRLLLREPGVGQDRYIRTYIFICTHVDFLSSTWFYHARLLAVDWGSLVCASASHCRCATQCGFGCGAHILAARMGGRWRRMWMVFGFI